MGAGDVEVESGISLIFSIPATEISKNAVATMLGKRDVKERMNPRIRVHVKMYLEKDGGRHGPFWAGYRPHLMVEGSADYLGIIVTEPKQEGMIHPGEAGEIKVELVYHPQVDYSSLNKGRRFKILEGARTVGEGRVLSDSYASTT